MDNFIQIQELINKIKSELQPYYPEEEIQSFIFLLFQHYLNYSKIDLLGGKKKIINLADIKKLSNAIEELKQNKPIQYILGETVFYNLHLAVSPAVLIPRPETEELVNDIVQNTSRHNIRILDVGTGSGCIAIALAKYLPRSEVFAVDISGEAIKLAEANAVKNEVIVNFKEFDIFSNDYDEFPEFDIIVSNPPYIPLGEKKDLPPNVKFYEPSIALYVDSNNPLKFYEAIIALCDKRLKQMGWIYFEIHEKFGHNLVDFLSERCFFNITLSKDINGKNRVIKAQKNSNYLYE